MTSTRTTLLLLCCTGCFRETHRPACSEPVYTELADDEASPGGITPDSLLAIATPGWEGVADHFGSEVDASFAVARGDGPAFFADTEVIDIVTRHFDPGGGDEHLLVGVMCDDWVEVPAELTIASEEAEIDLAMDATIRSPGLQSQGTNPGADVVASVPYAESGLVLDGIDESYEEQSIGVSISMQPAAASVGRLYWTGSNENDGRLVEILTWDGD